MADATSRHGLPLEHLNDSVEAAGKGAVLEANVLEHLLRPEVWRDPYPFYATLRDHETVRQIGSMSGLVFARHADVEMLLRDRRFSTHWPIKYRRARSLSADEHEISERVLGLLSRGWTQSSDQELHRSIRRQLKPLFSAERIAQFEDKIYASACRLLAELASERSMDFMADFVQPLLDEMLAQVFGVSSEVCAYASRCSSAIVGFLGTADPSRQELERVDREMRALRDILAPIIAERRRHPRKDVIGALLGPGGVALSAEELAVQCSLTLSAGLDTTAGLLGNGLLGFLRHPDAIRRVKDNPGLIGQAVEECLRYDSPGQWLPRVACADVRVGGNSVRGGELVWLGLGSANRDTARFACADRFDISRRPRPSVSFGGGAHRCLGAHLARMEARIALLVVLTRLDDLGLAAEDVTYRANFGIRSPLALPIRFRPCNAPGLVSRR
jgi:cytochrome P450